MNRPDRFDIPGLSPEWHARMEAEFAKLLADIPKPVTPEKESDK